MTSSPSSSAGLTGSEDKACLTDEKVGSVCGAEMTDTEILLREDYHGYVLVARWRPAEGARHGHWQGQAGSLDMTLPEPNERDVWSWDDDVAYHVKTELEIPLGMVMRGPSTPENVVHVINGQDGRGDIARGLWPDWTVNDVFESLKRWIDSA